MGSSEDFGHGENNVAKNRLLLNLFVKYGVIIPGCTLDPRIE